MSVFISDIDTAKLYVQLLQIIYCALQDLYRRTISTVGSFIIDLNKDYKWSLTRAFHYKV